MATISATVVQTGFANASKTYNLSDADMQSAIDAFQKDAENSLFGLGNGAGTATRGQILNYMFDTLIVRAIQQKVQQHATVPASVPPPISIT